MREWTGRSPIKTSDSNEISIANNFFIGTSLIETTIRPQKEGREATK